MTVRELISELAKVNKDYEVILDIKAVAPNFDQSLVIQNVYESGGVFFIQGKEGF